FFILKDQISSDYLQNYHNKSFLLLPLDSASFIFDLKLLSGIISQVGGVTVLALAVNSILLVLGSVALYKKEKLRSILFFVPILLLLFASLLHKYALVDRLLLFIHPIIFLILAYGVFVVYQFQNKLSYALITLILGINIYNKQHFKSLFEKFEIQEIHYALDEIESKYALEQVDPIWVHNGAVPAFIFYTEMSPKKKKYAVLSNQKVMLSWDANYEALCAELVPGERVWVLLTNYYPEEKETILDAMAETKLLATLDKPGCLLLYYEK
ncbi:MAG: hypothetical protein WD512_08750, partial [Candidatus Paceibacterota bacterium]